MVGSESPATGDWQCERPFAADLAPGRTLMLPQRRLAMINSDAKLRPPLADRDGIRTELFDLRFRHLARTPYDHLFAELATVAAIEAATSAGCDAAYIDSFGDYGIERARSSATIPVLGAGEASLAAAAQVSERFSIVTVWPRSMAYLYEGRLAACVGGERCAAVHFVSDEEELDRVGTASGVKARMLRSEAGLVDLITEHCLRAVRQDDCGAILLGCTCMAPIADRIERQVPVPVLEPSRIGQEAAFDLLGEQLSRPPAASVTNRSGLATAFIDAYLAAKEVDFEASDECDVCLLPQQ